MRKNILLVLMLTIAATLSARSHKLSFEVYAVSVDSFPVPPTSRNLLFYVQRTSNINTVMYDINPTAAGKLDNDVPVHIYWIRYAEQGQKEELTYIQRNFAYGLNFKAEKAGVSEFSFVSYKKMKMYLQYSDIDKKFVAWTQLGTKKVNITRLFVKISGGTFWVPKVDFIEVKGFDQATGKPVTERFKP